MKLTIIALLLLIISVDVRAQKVDPIIAAFSDTANYPMLKSGKLYEHVVARGKDGNIFWSGFQEIKSCEEFKKFRKKFPKFYIPKQIANRFKKCKP